MERKGILTATGGTVWHEKVIQGMLSNEKYCGDSMLRKTISEDLLTGKRIKNDGYKTRYYVHDSHEGIISKEDDVGVKITIKFAPVPVAP